MGFQNQQKNNCLHWVLNSQHQPHYKNPSNLTHSAICQSIQVQFKDILFNKCLGGRVVKVAGILIVGLVVVSSIPSGGNFFFADFETRNVNFVQE